MWFSRYASGQTNRETTPLRGDANDSMQVTVAAARKLTLIHILFAQNDMAYKKQRISKTQSKT